MAEREGEEKKRQGREVGLNCITSTRGEKSVACGTAAHLFERLKNNNDMMLGKKKSPVCMASAVGHPGFGITFQVKKYS